MSTAEYFEKIKAMGKEELKKELENLHESLEDVTDEKRLILGQTGVHINATTVSVYRESFDREIALFEQKISKVKEYLGS